ncbi:unnamed protein product [Boreogadus saida]
MNPEPCPKNHPSRTRQAFLTHPTRTLPSAHNPRNPAPRAGQPPQSRSFLPPPHASTRPASPPAKPPSLDSAGPPQTLLGRGATHATSSSSDRLNAPRRGTAATRLVRDAPTAPGPRTASTRRFLTSSTPSSAGDDPRKTARPRTLPQRTLLFPLPPTPQPPRPLDAPLPRPRRTRPLPPGRYPSPLLFPPPGHPPQQRRRVLHPLLGTTPKLNRLCRGTTPSPRSSCPAAPSTLLVGRPPATRPRLGPPHDASASDAPQRAASLAPLGHRRNRALPPDLTPHTLRFASDTPRKTRPGLGDNLPQRASAPRGPTPITTRRGPLPLTVRPPPQRSSFLDQTTPQRPTLLFLGDDLLNAPLPLTSSTLLFLGDDPLNAPLPLGRPPQRSSLFLGGNTPLNL